MELDDTICYCFHVSKRKIVNFLRLHRPSRASQLSECGGAGTGCGWCVPFLRRYFAEGGEQNQQQSDQMTPEEYARERGAYLKSGKGVAPPGAIPPPNEA